ncbi:protein of unknown function [Paenibacillus alvei]|uniref:Uncharacterized protein n=1 Tax=Paenibacillus alvei TaxID=44250 RepID=A0A383RJ55_PAEAL|nr:protein of unknown function [Paenibacillus alvei]
MPGIPMKKIIVHEGHPYNDVNFILGMLQVELVIVHAYASIALKYRKFLFLQLALYELHYN